MKVEEEMETLANAFYLKSLHFKELSSKSSLDTSDYNKYLGMSIAYKDSAEDLKGAISAIKKLKSLYEINY